MASSSTTSQPALHSHSSRPQILILALDKMSFYTEYQAAFIAQLSEQADVQQITTPRAARDAFQRSPAPAIILSVDESLAISTRRTLLHEAASYVRAGGVLLFIGMFASFTRPPDIDRLFAQFDLPWTAGTYERTTFKLNRAGYDGAVQGLATGGLAEQCNVKALQVAHVAVSDAIYLPTEHAPVEDRTQTPAALTRVGQGRVGYLGDVNNEDETTLIALAMCGLLG